MFQVIRDILSPKKLAADDGDDGDVDSLPSTVTQEYADEDDEDKDEEDEYEDEDEEDEDEDEVMEMMTTAPKRTTTKPMVIKMCNSCMALKDDKRLKRHYCLWLHDLHVKQHASFELIKRQIPEMISFLPEKFSRPCIIAFVKADTLRIIREIEKDCEEKEAQTLATRQRITTILHEMEDDIAFFKRMEAYMNKKTEVVGEDYPDRYVKVTNGVFLINPKYIVYHSQKQREMKAVKSIADQKKAVKSIADQNKAKKKTK